MDSIGLTRASVFNMGYAGRAVGGPGHWPKPPLTESKAAIVPLPELPTVEKVAASLNALGVTPRDIMAIFQAMKQAGALQAELVIQ